MYLSRIIAENFRIFGSKLDGRHLDLELQPGLNVLVGENDCGKTAVIDSIRALLGMTSDEWYRLAREDFHVAGTTEDTRAHSITLECEFRDLNKEDGAAFLEWLTLVADGEAQIPILRLVLQATRRDLHERTSRWEREIDVTVKAGMDFETGHVMDASARELLQATYLKPLRDAERNRDTSHFPDRLNRRHRQG